MKRTGIAIFLLFLLVFAGCKDESESPNMSVERYVELLKTGKYDDWKLPAFSAKDIAELLAYRNDTRMISNFPVNPISSSWNPEISLGMYVLWTIESIRAGAVESEGLIGSFPSQNPVVKNRYDFSFIEQNPQVQTAVADAYFEWWEGNKGKDFSQFHQIDPLGSTDYRWH